jgi:hypothetical protein
MKDALGGERVIVVDKQVKWLIVSFVYLELFFIFLDLNLPGIVHHLGCKFAFGTHHIIQTESIDRSIFKLYS